MGAVYPLSGSQGPGGIDEFHGVQLATSMVNADGGVAGRQIHLIPLDVPGSDAACVSPRPAESTSAARFARRCSAAAR